jgi:Uma2 family endonuclease
MTETVPPGLDLGRIKLLYGWAEQRYRRSLPQEHFMEAYAQGTQRKITLESFDLIRVSRPDVQCFNELLVQFPKPGDDPEKPGQIVPDNMIVVHSQPIIVDGSYNTPLQPAHPFLVLEYVSKYNKRKDYEISYDRYQSELRVPYYLLFYPDADEMRLFHLRDGKYITVVPNAAGRCAIPELELEVALHERWVRYWFRGELLPLPGDLLRQLNEIQSQLAEKLEELTAAQSHLAEKKEELTAEQAARQAAERRVAEQATELARLREELAKATGKG